MRFLLGLILGAAMVVVVAESMAGGGNWEAGLLAVRDYVQHKTGNWRAEPRETTRSGEPEIRSGRCTAPSRGRTS